MHAFEGTSIETLDVLEIFELCYGFDQDGVKMYVFPSLLRTEPSETAWAKNEVFDTHLGLVFSCKSATTMIPPGFFQRLQVRIRLEIGPKFTAGGKQSDSIWFNGTTCSLG